MVVEVGDIEIAIGGDGAPPGGLEFTRPRSRPADGPERYAAEAEYKDIIGAIAA